jgi:hypothetical protein
MNNDDYETIVFEHNFQKEIMTKSLDVVKKFIQLNNRILAGGMAIDIALRSKGSYLYPDNKFPDYDFYSSEFHKDAYTLGNTLSKEFDGVSVISAFHVSTMRVRVNFQETADITYIPPQILKNIPTIKHMGFTVVHPHYQMIDQHRALSLPFEMPPMETIMSRWNKDIERYDILSKAFPLSSKIVLSESDIEYDIPFEFLYDQCISGYPSVLYWVQRAKSDGYKMTDSMGWLNSFTEKKNGIKCSLPESAVFNILSDDLDNLSKKIPSKNITRFNAIVDKVPNRIRIKTKKDNTYEIINNHGDLRGAHKINNNIYVSNLQEVMCYLLTIGILYDDTLAINTYIIAQKILFFACSSYAETKHEKWLPYLPTTEVYGKCNSYDAYIVSKNNLDSQLTGKPKTFITPKNAYPTKNKSVKPELYEFIPADNILFQFDGEEVVQLNDSLDLQKCKN